MGDPERHRHGMSCHGQTFDVLDGDLGIGVDRRHRHLTLGQQGDMFFHAPLRLVQAILDRMADSRESFQFRRVEAKEIRLFRCFNDQRIRQVPG